MFDAFIKEINSLKNVKIAVVSSNHSDCVNHGIKKSKLKPTHVLCFDDHHSKEEKIEMIAKKWGVDKKEVYYFTDTKADVYELENFLDRKKIIGCSWGWAGVDKLREVLPENQILKTYKDIHALFEPKKGRRETNTMPQWAGSSWYYLAYASKKSSRFTLHVPISSRKSR